MPGGWTHGQGSRLLQLLVACCSEQAHRHQHRRRCHSLTPRCASLQHPPTPPHTQQTPNKQTRHTPTGAPACCAHGRHHCSTTAPHVHTGVCMYVCMSGRGGGLCIAYELGDFVDCLLLVCFLFFLSLTPSSSSFCPAAAAVTTTPNTMSCHTCTHAHRQVLDSQ